MNIVSHTYEDFIEIVRSFHNYPAPGVIVGGFMVDLAIKKLGEDILYDAISETKACLPDAIQLLTPCTIGNGWLRVLDLNRYAMSLFDKHTGEGVRVYVDSQKLNAFPAIKNWLFKLQPKKEQNSDLLAEQVKEAGASICSVASVIIKPELVGKKHKGCIMDCPECKEAYPIEDGNVCRACQGGTPYDPA